MKTYRPSFRRQLAVALLWLTTVASCVGAPVISVTDYPSIHEAVAQNPGRRLYVPSGNYVLTNAILLKADNAELEGPGILLQSNPAAAVIEVRAPRVRLRNLILTRVPGNVAQSMLESNAVITEGLNAHAIETADAEYSGMLPEETGVVLTLALPNGQRVSIEKRNTKQHTTLKTSAMPSSAEVLSPQQVADITAFLLTRKNPGTTTVPAAAKQ